MLHRTLSWAAVTQLSLAGTQLLLLPLQVRLWGLETTAHWNTAVALAALLSAADFGLRSFGHDSLRRDGGAGKAAGAFFASVWAAQRLLAAAVLLLAATAAAVAMWLRLSPAAGWVLWLAVAFAMEALLGARLMYMDTIGMIARAEASYAFMASSRLVAALLALTAFDAPPLVLAVIYAVSAVTALLSQGPALRHAPALRLSAGGFHRMDRHTFELLRFSIAYPVAQWCRTNLPVLVLGAVASAAIVNTYVALRAVFGLARQFVLQLSRHASVQYADTAGAEPRRRSLLLWTYAGTLAGTACALAVEMDAGTLLGIWIPGISAPGYRWVSLSFSVLGPFFATQVLLLACMRAGGERLSARLQWVYIVLAVLAALATLAASSLAGYFTAFVACELLYAAALLSSTRELEVTGAFLRWALTGLLLVLAAASLATWTGQQGGHGHELLRAGIFMALLAPMLVHARGLPSRLKIAGGPS